ncbi:DUF7503 family protein [Halogranum rubrum]|nr:hypothetical protein [Halogranum salarium]
MNQKMADYLKQNPRMIGVLFTMVLLLSHATPVLAGGSGGTSGP